MPWRLRSAPQPDSWFGLPPARLAAELDLVAELGVELVRFELPWALIEPEPPARAAGRWEAADAIVEGCRSRGLEPVPVLIWTPPWAAEAPNLPPREPGWFAEFAAAAAARYRERARWYELWNEPNLARYWEAPIRHYAAGILRAGSTGVRAADPDARVVLAGLAQGGGLGEVLAVETGAFDAAALHYYPPRRLAGWRARPERAVAAFRETLARAGLAHLPVWLGEVGGMAGASSPRDDNPVSGPRGQVRLLRRAVERARADAVLWYTLRDHDVCEVRGPVKRTTWGLYDRELRRRPVARVLSAYGRRAVTQ